jgi:cytochrome c-type biogenesis protein CcmH
VSRRAAGAGVLALVAVVLAAAAALTFVALRGPSGQTSLQDRVRAVGKTLRCPVCQELSVADSPSELAQQMRATIARELGAGWSADRIRTGFVHAYGEWILLAPPKSGLTLVAWLLPGLLVAAGFVVAVLAVRRWTIGRAASVGSAGAEGSAGVGSGDPLGPADRRLLERALASQADEGPA